MAKGKLEADSTGADPQLRTGVLCRFKWLKTEFWYTWAASEKETTRYEALGPPNPSAEATWTPRCCLRMAEEGTLLLFLAARGWVQTALSSLRHGDLSETDGRRLDVNEGLAVASL